MRDHTKQYKWLTIILLLLLLAPYLYISQYSNPVADDLICAFSIKVSPLPDILHREYMSWSGRYTSNLLIFVSPIAFNLFSVYKMIPLFLIVLTVISYLFFISVICENNVDLSTKVILALLLSLLFFHQMPIISEGIYWYTGAVTYQLANVITVTYIACLIRFTNGKLIFKNKLIHLALLTLLLIISIGFNEIHMLVLLAFACISFIIVWKKRSPQKKLFLFLLVITVVFSAVSYFAPGNEARSGLAINTHRFIPSFLFSLAQTLRFFLEWASSIPLLLSSFLYYYLNKRLSEGIQLFSYSFYLTPFWSCSFLFCVIFIAAFPPYWATGMLGQHRTLNVAYSFFLLMWFMNLTVYFNLYKEELKALKPLNLQFRGTLIVIVLIALSFSKNGYAILTDIFYGKAQLYDKQMTERYELMKHPADTVYFHPIMDPPKTIFVNDITTDPQHWLNKAYTLYFECGDKALVKK